MTTPGSQYGAFMNGGGQVSVQAGGAPMRATTETEGWWGLLLTVVIVAAAVGTGAFVGVGTWRVVHDVAPLADLKDGARVLNANATALLEDAQLIIPPDNCTVYVGNQTQPDEYPSDEFFVFSGGDSDLQIDFDTSQLTEGATVFLQPQNTSGVVAYTEDVEGDFTTFLDSVFTLFNAADNDKEVRFGLDGLAPQSTVTLSPQATSGTIAYLSDVPAQVTEFADDEFTLETFQSGDGTAAMLDASALTANTTRVLTAQDADGTITYLANVTALVPVMLDSTLLIYHDASPTSKARFDLEGVPNATDVTLAFQDRSGTIAYRDDIPSIVFTEVDITESGTFPDVDREGFVTLQEGSVVQIEITMCGGGGAGVGGCAAGGANDTRFQVGGGGAGGAIEGFLLRNVSDLYESLVITIGERGVAEPAPTVEGDHVTFEGGQGGNTVVEALRITPLADPLELVAYGGQRGLGATGTEPDATYYGGCGGGSGGRVPLDPASIEPAPGGDTGGVAGACGDAAGFAPVAPSVRYPWRAGGHGSERRANVDPVEGGGGYTVTYYVCEEANSCGSSSMLNGGRGGHASDSSTTWVAGGGGGLFGPGGTPGSPNAGANTCAGGGVGDIGQPFPECSVETHRTGAGGSGRVLLRYWTTTAQSP